MSRLLFESFSRILAEWRFNTANAGETGSGYEAESTAPDGSASDVSDGGANVAITVDNSFGYDGGPVVRVAPATTASATVADAVTNSSYIQFTYTPSASRRALLEKLTFRVARGGASTPRGWALRSSLDGYTTNIATSDVATLRPTWTDVTVDLAAVQNYSGPVTFRLYVYTPAIGSSLEFDNIELWGRAEATAAISGWGNLRPGSITNATTSTRFSPSTRLRYTTSAPNQPMVMSMWVSFPTAPTSDTTIFAWNVNDSGAAYRMSVGVTIDGGQPKFSTDSSSVGGVSSVVVRAGQWYKLVVRTANADGSGIELFIDENYTFGAQDASQGPFAVPGGSFVSLTFNGNEAGAEQGTFDIRDFRWYTQDYAPDNAALKAALLLDLAQPSPLLPMWAAFPFGGSTLSDYTDVSGNGRTFTLTGTLQSGQVGPAGLYPNQTMGIAGSGDRGAIGYGHLMAGYTAPVFANGSIRTTGAAQYLSRAFSGVSTSATWVASIRIVNEPTTDFSNIISLWENNGYGGTYLQIYLGDGSSSGPGRRDLSIDASGISGGFASSGIQLQLYREYRLAVVLDGAADEIRVYLDNALVITRTGVTGSFSASNMSVRIGSDSAGADGCHETARFRLWSRALTAGEISSEYGFERAVADDATLVGDWPLPNTSSLDDAAHASNAMSANGTPGNGAAFAGGARFSGLSGSGSVLETLTGSGSLQPAACTISGSGAVVKAGSGALQPGASTIAGAGTVREVGSGNLAPAAPTISGSGTVQETGTGALQPGASTIAGAGSRIVTGSGALQPAACTIAGSGSRVVTGSGSLQPGACAASGSGVTNETGSGDLQPGACSISGSGDVDSSAELDGTGDLQPAACSIAGVGTVQETGSGNLAPAACAIAGVGTVQETGSGALAPGASTTAGVGAVIHVGSGALQAGSCSIAGSGGPANSSNLVCGPATIAGAGAVVHAGSGALQPGPCAISGAGARVATGAGALAPGACSVSGAGVVGRGATGNLQPGPCAITGVGKVTETGTGALASGAGSVAGAGAVTKVGTGALTPAAPSFGSQGTVVHPGSGVLAAGPCLMAGVGSVVHAGTGGLVCGEPTVSGLGACIKVGTGALQPGPCVIFGLAGQVRMGSGDLVPGPASIAGTGVVNTTRVGSGSLLCGPSSVAGVGMLLPASLKHIDSVTAELLWFDVGASVDVERISVATATSIPDFEVRVTAR